MPTAELIAIGTELLLGEIQDTNSRYLARNLRDLGINLFRFTAIGDNAERIAALVREALSRTDIIITTGGLGPTVDDPTRLAIALAVGQELEYHPELWEQILDRFKRYNRVPGENNKRQAYIPAGALVIENPVGTAPSFAVEVGAQVIISLPGVPREMEYLTQNRVLPYLRERFRLAGTIKACVLHTATLGESMVDELIGDLETLENPTVGLLAHPGQVDVRVTAKADTEEEADRLIAGVIDTLYARLGSAIFGRDGEKLEEVALKNLRTRCLPLQILECGLGGVLLPRLTAAFQDDPNHCIEISGEILSHSLSPEDLETHTASLLKEARAVVLAASLKAGPVQQDLTMLLIDGESRQELHRSYGGPPQNAAAWAVNLALDFLRLHA
jgi:competence/damage-inducible protein CinA-like protein